MINDGGRLVRGEPGLSETLDLWLKGPPAVLLLLLPGMLTGADVVVPKPRPERYAQRKGPLTGVQHVAYFCI